MIVKSLLAASLIGCLSPEEPIDSLMRKEADAFIARMGKELQPRQRDAIWNAIQGDVRELNQVRNARNVRPLYLENVKVSEPAERMRLYTNTGTPAGNRPLLIYLHGGGWTIGSLNSCARFCSELCSQSGASVLAVDYRLAPEHPYPTPLDDCEAAIHFALANACQWGCSPRKVIVGGDSSGGNLAIASTLRMKQNDVAGLLLFYPVVKAWKAASSSWQSYALGFGLDSDLMEAFNRSYISPKNASNPEVSPSCATDKVLKRLPCTLLIAAGRDILADQGKEFIERITAIGVDAKRIEFPSAVHLFITVPGQDTAFEKAVKEAKRFINTIKGD